MCINVNTLPKRSIKEYQQFMSIICYFPYPLVACGDYDADCGTNWPQFTCDFDEDVQEYCPAMCGLCSKLTCPYSVVLFCNLVGSMLAIFDLNYLNFKYTLFDPHMASSIKYRVEALSVFKLLYNGALYYRQAKYTSKYSIEKHN